jgi:membrane protein
MEIRQNLERLNRYIKTVVHNVVHDRVFFRATSLAFTTFISMVPLTMIIFAFGGFDQLGNRLLDAIGTLMLPEANAEMLVAFEIFTSNARRLGTWGTLLFLFAAIMLFNAMETHLNDIFRARSRKGPIFRVGMYVASLALISLVFGAGFGPISGMLDAWDRIAGPGQAVLGIILSILGTMAGMMMIFFLMSAARVKFRSAVLGSFIGALSFQAAKYGFTFWTSNSARQSIIYGSVVFIPLLLIWLSIAWIVILITAEIIYAHQTGAGRKPPMKYATPAFEAQSGWKIYLALADDFRQAKAPPGIKALASRLFLDERRVDIIIQRLEDGGLVHQVNHQPTGYVPAVAPADLSAAKVFSVISGWNRDAEGEDLSNAMELIRDGIEKAFGDRSVRSFLLDEETNSTS